MEGIALLDTIFKREGRVWGIGVGGEWWVVSGGWWVVSGGW